jgi:hypothetical protein
MYIYIKHSHYRPVDPEVSGRLRLPESGTPALEGGIGCQPYVYIYIYTYG